MYRIDLVSILHGMLLAILLREAASISPPKALDHRQPSPCNTAGFSAPVYRISSFQYARTYDGDIQTQLLGYPDFVVTDIANNSTTGCNMHRPWTENTVGDYRTCFQHGENAKDYPSMEFNYLFDAGQLSIRQSWACNHPDHSFEYVIHYLHPTRRGTAALLTLQIRCSTMWQAIGTVNLKEKPTCGANASEIEPHSSTRNRTKYIVNCTLADEDVPHISSKLTLLEYPSNSNSAAAAIAPKPQDTPFGDVPCFGRSFTYPNWRITNVTGGSNASTGVFSLQNRATKRTVSCPAGQVGWVSCATDGAGSEVSTYIKHQAATSSFSVNQTWTCEATAGAKRCAIFFYPAEPN